MNALTRIPVRISSLVPLVSVCALLAGGAPAARADELWNWPDSDLVPFQDGNVFRGGNLWDNQGRLRYTRDSAWQRNLFWNFEADHEPPLVPDRRWPQYPTKLGGIFDPAFADYPVNRADPNSPIYNGPDVYDFGPDPAKQFDADQLANELAGLPNGIPRRPDDWIDQNQNVEGRWGQPVLGDPNWALCLEPGEVAWWHLKNIGNDEEESVKYLWLAFDYLIGDGVPVEGIPLIFGGAPGLGVGGWAHDPASGAPDDWGTLAVLFVFEPNPPRESVGIFNGLFFSGSSMYVDNVHIATLHVIPSPGAGALLGLGALIAARRRR